MKVLCILVFVTCSLAIVAASHFKSSDFLISLIETSKDITQLLQSTARKYESQNKKLISRLKDFCDLNKAAEKDGKKFVSNPINRLLLVKQMSVGLTYVKDLFKRPDIKKHLFARIQENYHLPTRNDYEDIILELHQLFDTYQLNVTELSRGKVGKGRSFRPLNTMETYDIGHITMKKEDYYHALLWTNLTMTSILAKQQKKKLKEKLMNLDAALNDHIITIYKQDNLKAAIMGTKFLYKRGVVGAKQWTQTLIDELKADQKKFNEPLPPQLKNVRPSLPDYLFAYESLCRDEKFYAEPIKFTCRYFHNHPYFLIGPAKEETIYERPTIKMYHDSITREHALSLKKQSFGLLNKGKDASNQSLLFGFENSALSHLSVYLEAFTKSNSQFLDSWKVVHGLGVQNTLPLESGAYFYWSTMVDEAELGGSLIFPELGVRIKQPGQSSLFWFNSDNEAYRVLKSDCPVLLGSKLSVEKI